MQFGCCTHLICTAKTSVNHSSECDKSHVHHSGDVMPLERQIDNYFSQKMFKPFTNVIIILLTLASHSARLSNNRSPKIFFPVVIALAMFP